MDKSRISIIIPALNESATIANVVMRVKKFGIPIVVDDGSIDNTTQIACDAGAIVIKHEENKGYDQALSSGFLYANQNEYKYVITIDADGQHDPQMLANFISHLTDEVDLVIGVRDRFQRYSESLFALISFIKWGLKDPLCGMKAYSVDLYKELGHFDSYGSVGTELAIYAAKNNKKIIQIPIVTCARVDKSRFGSRWSANKKILRALGLGLGVFKK